jgi:3-phosphoshikimate 1-carboxyvinyltransferase
MTRLVVRPARKPLTGSVPVPSDKSISHRALILAAIAGSRSELRRFSYGDDNLRTLGAFRAMGIATEDDGQGTIRVAGRGLLGLSQAASEIDCGNSGTTMRLLSGLLAAQPFRARLVGDASLSRRPMGRVVKPLRMRGAKIAGTLRSTDLDDVTAPLEIGPLEPGRKLDPLEYRLPVASAQLKSALLLSGLYASGPTIVQEPVVSRDHTERMLDALGVPIETAGSAVSLHPPADPMALPGFEADLPGDLSAAAFLLVAASLVEGSSVTTRATGLNPTRSGILDMIRAFGGATGVAPQGAALNEPFGEVTARHAVLRSGRVGGELAVRAIDEIPIASALAARARGTSEFFDLAELRVKESDRIRMIAETLRAFGLEVEERGDGFAVEGQPDHALRAARVASGGDHRIAMTAVVLALLADGESVIEDVDCIATSFPRFVGTLRALGADLEAQAS